jgi:uncharacterized membrane protein YqjE
MTDDSSKQLTATIKRLVGKARGRRQAREAGIAPGCAYGMLVEERLRLAEREMRELKGRINGLLFLIAALIAAEVIIRLVD